MTTRFTRAALALAALAAFGLCGCGSGSADDSSATSTASPSSTTKAAASATAKGSAKATTSTLGTLPPVLSSSSSAVRSDSIRSADDLPAAFKCPSTPTPITMAATATSPAGVVCASALAKDEALFLWYTGTADERYLALQTAMAKARYVHAGPGWVAGGMLDPGMGDVGGDVYK